MNEPKPNRKASRQIRLRLADNVLQLRRTRGYTQQMLAERSGLSKSYVSNVEQATVNISLANIEALADGLGCSEAALLVRPLGDR
jgi:transcriptional regulator with XRE-family HTH domain